MNILHFLSLQISASVVASDLFEGTKTISYNDSVNFVVVSLQQCILSDECDFTDSTCRWQTVGATVTTASAIQITDRNSGKFDHNYLYSESLL